MRKDAFEWEFQKEEHQQPKGVNAEPTINWLLLTSLCVLNAMSPCSPTIFVHTVELTRGERLSRWKKRSRA
jgi:hypothetical protein